MSHRFVSIAEACERLDCSRQYLYDNYIDKKKLTPIKRGKGKKVSFLEIQINSVIIAEAKEAGVELSGGAKW